MPDERDLGNRPLVSALVPLMDELEAKEKQVAGAAHALDRAAQLDISAGNYDHAIALLRSIVELYRAAKVSPYRIPEYEQRIADCESLKKMKRRRTPGRKHR
jgi:hypothetical protein